jgi:hypothetical protein
VYDADPAALRSATKLSQPHIHRIRPLVLGPLPQAKPFQLSVVKSCEVLNVLLVPGLEAGAAARSLV